MRLIFIMSHQRRKFFSVEFFPNYGMFTLSPLMCSKFQQSIEHSSLKKNGQKEK